MYYCCEHQFTIQQAKHFELFQALLGMGIYAVGVEQDLLSYCRPVSGTLSTWAFRVMKALAINHAHAQYHLAKCRYTSLTVSQSPYCQLTVTVFVRIPGETHFSTAWIKPPRVTRADTVSSNLLFADSIASYKVIRASI
jgi:hypothetical protein